MRNIILFCVMFTSISYSCFHGMDILHSAHQSTSDSFQEDRDIFGNTALIMACKDGKAEIAEALINAGASIDVRNRKGRDALYYAIKRKSLACIDLLFGRLNDASKATLVREHLLPWIGLETDVREGFTILAVRATRLGFVHLLDYLLRSFDINEHIDTERAAEDDRVLRIDGKSLVHIACEAKSLKSLMCLQKKGGKYQSRGYL